MAVEAKKLRKLAGTFIEPMVVAIVIGALASIAAPNLLEYQSKARQAEAKINLAALYSAEQSFYAEYSAYITSLDAVGFVLDGDRRFYSIGWGGESAGVVSGYLGVNSTPLIDRANHPSAWSKVCPPNWDAGGVDLQVLYVSAQGVIRDGGACDVWYLTVNHPTFGQQKRITHIRSGL